MILTCSNCQNTYFMDDQVYAQQGEAICEQCHQVLIPVPEEQQGQWQDQGQLNQQGQWDQQSQWNQQGQGQWNQQGQTALPPTMWGLKPVQKPAYQQGGEAQWGQQGGETQWGQQPAGDAQWGQQPAGWGQQPAGDAQWGQQPAGDAQWGQQPAGDAQWGQQPAGWGQQPAGDAQWGQQPAGGSQWGSQEQWSQMADQLDDDFQVVNHNDSNEKTMAIDSFDDVPSAGGAIPNIQNSQSNDDDNWDAWNQSKETSPKPAPALSSVSQPGNAHSIVVGKEMGESGHDNVTRQIDVEMVQKIYGEEVNPVKEFFTSIPLRFHIIAGSVVVVALIALFVGNYFITKPAEVEKKFNEQGDVITDDTPAPVKSFSDIANEMKLLSSSFVPYDGDDMTEGSIVAITKTNGIVMDNENIGKYALVEKGNIYSSGLADVIKKDSDMMGKPVVILFDETMPMHAVYRAFYTISVAVNEFSRPVYIGGTTGTGISMVDIKPCKWPDHDLTTFGNCPSISVKLAIHTDEIVMSRPEEVPIPFKDADDADVTELTSPIIGGNKASMNEFKNEISRMRSSKTEALISTDGNVSFGLFMQIVGNLRGHRDMPNVYHMYLNDVATR